MVIELYDRTWEQNEELGLNDMKVEGYELDQEDEQTPTKDTEVDGKPNSESGERKVDEKPKPVVN